MALKDNAKCLPIARTGRVQDWIDDPDGRLPVSCTVFVVQDSMEGEDGIEDSWAFVSHALRNGAGVAIHLSKLRPKGTDNGKGLVSSGPVSFGMIYSKLNEVLRRGGKFKNGAVVLHLDYDHPDAMEFISAPRKDFQWAKRCVNVDDHFLEKSSPEFIAALTKAITQGDVWLMKMRTDDEGARIYGNVCVAGDTLVHTTEGPLPIASLVGKQFTAIVDGQEYESSPRGAWSNGTKLTYELCTVEGPSLRATPDHQILTSFAGGNGWTELKDLKIGDTILSGDGQDFFTVESIEIYTEQEVFDCSIPGVGAFSANGIYVSNCLEVLLPHRGTCLLQHVNLGALKPEEFHEAFVNGMKELCELHGKTGVEKGGHYLPPVIDRQVGLGILGLANCLAINGITYAELADALDAWFESDDAWERLSDTKAALFVEEFCYALDNAAQVADANNMARAFAIAPTASCAYRYLDAQGFTTAPELAPPIARLIDRDSSTFGVESFDHGSVEIASEVGWEVYKRVANGIVRMYEATGLFHGYSYNWWSDMTKCDEAFLKDWLESPQTSLYYALPVMPNAQAKDDAYVALDDDFKELFGLDEEQKLEQQCTSCSE